MSNEKCKIWSSAFCVIITASIFLLLTFRIDVSYCASQDTVAYKVVVTVDHNMIAMPSNNLKEVPIQYARIRSTPLRDLNKQYNAVKISRVFKTVKVGNRPPEDVEVPDTFMIIVEPGPDVIVQDMLDDYKALSVVTDAQQAQ